MTKFQIMTGPTGRVKEKWRIHGAMNFQKCVRHLWRKVIWTWRNHGAHEKSG